MMHAECTKVLVVDDEPALCELMRRYLTVEGYECFTALSGEEALKLMRETRFEMVVTDIMMPGMSGLDLLNVIKALYPDVAVVMVSAVDDFDTGFQAVELGAYGYVVKPFSKNQMLINAAAALERRRLNLLGEENRRNTPAVVRKMRPE